MILREKLVSITLVLFLSWTGTWMHLWRNSDRRLMLVGQCVCQSVREAMVHSSSRTAGIGSCRVRNWIWGGDVAVFILHQDVIDPERWRGSVCLRIGWDVSIISNGVALHMLLHVWVLGLVTVLLLAVHLLDWWQFAKPAFSLLKLLRFFLWAMRDTSAEDRQSEQTTSV